MADAPGTWAPDDDPRRGGKSAAAFRTISEVSSELDVPQHVLRFWESKFAQVKPLKRAGGRRYYRPEDVTLLRRIRDLLYRDGFTIKGAQKLLREGGTKGAATAATAPDPAANEAPSGMPDPGRSAPSRPASGATAQTAPASALNREALEAVLDELEAMRELLRRRHG